VVSRDFKTLKLRTKTVLSRTKKCKGDVLLVNFRTETYENLPKFGERVQVFNLVENKHLEDCYGKIVDFTVKGVPGNYCFLYRVLIEDKTTGTQQEIDVFYNQFQTM
jgi:hypothetical protein